MSQSTEVKLRALEVWREHDIHATMTAFQVSRSTLYAWRKAYQHGGAAALANRTTKPLRVRRRSYPRALIEQMRKVRREFPNIAGEALRVHLVEWCAENRMKCPSARTLGRIIADQPDRLRIAPANITRYGRLKAFTRQIKQRLSRATRRTTIPGRCVAFDTIVRHIDGVRRYLIVAIDHATRLSVAICPESASSKNAARFAELVEAMFPFPIENVLTDNGSEFAGAFDQFAKERGWTHAYTYPRSPKMNAIVERFNRTIQEDFVDYEEDLLLTDRVAFNQRLLDYLEKYNTRRPHASLQFRSPVQFIAENHPESRMYWHRTKS